MSAPASTLKELSNFVTFDRLYLLWLGATFAEYRLITPEWGFPSAAALPHHGEIVPPVGSLPLPALLGHVDE
jgi:hypothetical protein